MKENLHPQVQQGEQEKPSGLKRLANSIIHFVRPRQSSTDSTPKADIDQPKSKPPEFKLHRIFDRNAFMAEMEAQREDIKKLEELMENNMKIPPGTGRKEFRGSSA